MTTLLPSLLLLLFLSAPCSAVPRKLVLVKNQPLVLNYHNGPLLKGNYTLDLLFYGHFTSSQRAILSDFVTSLSSPSASVSTWWATTIKYKSGPTNILLGKQYLDPNYSLGKSLTSSNILTLASSTRHRQKKNTITAVLTSADVSAPAFCMSSCGSHRSAPGRFAYIWVGNSATQCPGQCAWPFHQPMYGPQGPPLGPPNADVGIDGMVINLATVLAGTVTNPFGTGFYQGSAGAPMEAVTACRGVFGSGSYPGYAGRMMVDPVTGASYNANGLNGRKYLLPAMWDPNTSQCATLV